jgi:hypothetical protein
MAKVQIPSRLVIHACPAAETYRIPSIESWISQPLLLGFQAGSTNLRLTVLEAEQLASELALVPNITFELTQAGRDSGVLFMHLPGQGIFRGELNAAGSLTLSEERLQLMLEQAVGNHREFTRLLRLALGQSWDDLLEPFRAIRHSENVVLLNRAG